MIELFESDIKQEGRRSSKGNQLKWETDGIWYKADYTGYEGLSEYIISHLLQKSSLPKAKYVLYDTEKIFYKAVTYNGCKSADFSGGWQIITLERLFHEMYGRSLYKEIYSITGLENRLQFLVGEVERTTGIQSFGKYICELFTLDAVFLNEDRHTHNISVLMNNAGDYRLCPIYDNGASLMSDTTMDYPLGIDIYKAIDSVRSKTICDSFFDQLCTAEKLYGQSMTFFWSAKDVEELLKADTVYGDDIKYRVRDILLEHRRKYSYLFK